MEPVEKKEPVPEPAPPPGGAAVGKPPKAAPPPEPLPDVPVTRADLKAFGDKIIADFKATMAAEAEKKAGVPPTQPPAPAKKKHFLDD